MRDLGKIFHAQPASKIAPSMRQHGLNAVRLRCQIEQRRELRLAVGATMVQHEPARNIARHFQP
jgi:hypothetical protein